MLKKTYKVTKEERKQAEKFADERSATDTSLYKRRGAFKRDDILIGALGEIAAYNLLKEKGYRVDKPDFSIHDHIKKSYNADLKDDKRFFHVKAQSTVSAKRYGNSWLFQKSDHLTQKGINNHYLVPCEVDLKL